MQKTELIHLHDLLGTVSTDLYEEGTLATDDLSAYRDLGTSPMSIRGSRADHEAAVIELADALAGAIESDRGDASTSEPHEDAESPVTA
ncbi:hypothetical protein SAMN05192561_101806 [Halopenitus malekzadehii]|uniref:Metal-binding protein n=1 Tax=Halopenitus malekzadehii TaxID=1267564 RepID=A0A1H6I2D1_9EURY|nr:UPF0058 family protein [Halopenitus malekzadehii]SEH41637.1 hypothetical protein SAMN05192561_101806 [Halopenitus malekzadehii]